ncbi:MAG: hypothetical protein MZU79_05450 [Anaerotruncus sp.]|nr:hypothetical protein [Anaerotruncus sp.]
MKKTIIAILALTFICAGLGLAQAKHPSELTYPALKYEPPDPKAFRTVYAGGLRAYVQEDRGLPLFNITAIVNCGDLYVPEGQGRARPPSSATSSSRAARPPRRDRPSRTASISSAAR